MKPTDLQDSLFETKKLREALWKKLYGDTPMPPTTPPDEKKEAVLTAQMNCWDRDGAPAQAIAYVEQPPQELSAHEKEQPKKRHTKPVSWMLVAALVAGLMVGGIVGGSVAALTVSREDKSEKPSQKNEVSSKQSEQTTPITQVIPSGFSMQDNGMNYKLANGKWLRCDLRRLYLEDANGKITVLATAPDGPATGDSATQIGAISLSTGGKYLLFSKSWVMPSKDDASVHDRVYSMSFLALDTGKISELSGFCVGMPEVFWDEQDRYLIITRERESDQKTVLTVATLPDLRTTDFRDEDAGAVFDHTPDGNRLYIEIPTKPGNQTKYQYYFYNTLVYEPLTGKRYPTGKYAKAVAGNGFYTAMTDNDHLIRREEAQGNIFRWLIEITTGKTTPLQGVPLGFVCQNDQRNLILCESNAGICIYDPAANQITPCKLPYYLSQHGSCRWVDGAFELTGLMDPKKDGANPPVTDENGKLLKLARIKPDGTFSLDFSWDPVYQKLMDLFVYDYEQNLADFSLEDDSPQAADSRVRYLMSGLVSKRWASFIDAIEVKNAIFDGKDYYAVSLQDFKQMQAIVLGDFDLTKSRYYDKELDWIAVPESECPIGVNPFNSGKPMEFVRASGFNSDHITLVVDRKSAFGGITRYRIYQFSKNGAGWTIQHVTSSDTLPDLTKQDG